MPQIFVLNTDILIFSTGKSRITYVDRYQTADEREMEIGDDRNNREKAKEIIKENVMTSNAI